MPASGTATFFDPGDYQAGFRGATINLVFTGPGIFTARLTTVSLSHLKLFSVQPAARRLCLAGAGGGEFFIFDACQLNADLGRARDEGARFDVP